LQIQLRVFLDAVIRKHAASFELPDGEDQVLLVWEGDAFRSSYGAAGTATQFSVSVPRRPSS